jgi:hypothetical protein
MTQEALKLALEAFHQIFNTTPVYHNDGTCIINDKSVELSNKAIAAIKEALAQPEQEPVGDDWTPCMKLPVVVYVRKQRLGESHVSTREGITPVKPDDLIMRGVSGEEYPIGRAIFEQTYSLNTTPPQRTWVGLTDDEHCEIWYKESLDWMEYGKAIDDKLKQKNGFAEEKNT